MINQAYAGGVVKKGHKKKQCLIKKMEEAQKKVNAVISNNISTSLMLNTIRRNDDLVSRVNARESDDICCGIVLDTGAQASVTGSVENLHLFRLTLFITCLTVSYHAFTLKN